MRIDRVVLQVVRLPLRTPFRTSSSAREAVTHVVVRVDSDGLTGWGECAAPVDPYYAPETAGTCFLILRDFLAPAVVGRPWRTLEELVGLFGPIKGNRFARAGLELACADLLCRAQGRPLAEWLGGTRATVESGVSLGIEEDARQLLARIDGHLAEGYRRIKLKIAPGRDVDVVRSVREDHPGLPLQVDANSAYTLEDATHLARLDEFGLLMIEQPLADDDIVDHAALQRRLRTSICLDESLHSAADVRKALELGSCRVVNVKPGRVGGLLEARRIHDLCAAQGVPVWCGGMHEFGIGRAANVALASLPGFTLPGDVSGSEKYYAEDLVEPPIRAEGGTIAVVRDRPGLGVEVRADRVDRATLERAEVTTGSAHVAMRSPDP
jgi:O-succinylbenzoate synthase